VCGYPIPICRAEVCAVPDCHAIIRWPERGAAERWCLEVIHLDLLSPMVRSASGDRELQVGTATGTSPAMAGTSAVWAFYVNLSATRPVRLARWRQYTLTTGEKLSWSREHGGTNPNDSNSRKHTSARSRTVSPFRDNIGTGRLSKHRLMLNDCDRSRDQWLRFEIER
jgi:hypothetical protein